MERYNSTSLALAEEQAERDCFEEVKVYLSAEDGYWLKHDIWTVDSGKFTERGISLEGKRKGVIADFSTLPDDRVKTELKYHALWSLSMKRIAPSTYAENYKSAVRDLGKLLQTNGKAGSVMDIQIDENESGTEGWADFHRNTVLYVINQSKTLLADIYDVRNETERDVWRALRIPGARLSAVQKHSKPTLCFAEIPDYYKREHWRIENCLHYVLDESFREDKCTARKSKKTLSVLRKFAYNVIRLIQLLDLSEDIPFTHVMDDIEADLGVASKYLFKPIPSMY